MTDTFDVADVAWVMGKDDLRHMLASIEAAPVVSFDLETTGLDEHATTGGVRNGGIAARIVMASFTVRPGGPQRRATNWVLPLSHPESSWSGQWRKVMRVVAKRLRGKRLIAHNGKYDLRYTYAATALPGVPEGKPIYDKADADLFERGHVSNTGYWRVYQKGGPTSGVAVHDLIAERALGPKPDGYSVDHWNRDPLDNRRKNLRYVTASEQMQNRRSWGKSGVRGAYYIEKSGRYEAALRINGKRKYLGTYATAEEAGAAVLAFQTRSDGKPPKSLRAQPGVDLSSDLQWDTMLSSGLLDENISKQLKERAPDTFGVPRWDDVDLKYPGAAEHEPMIKLGEYACIAEGQPVLTDRGEVPIEQVLPSDRLWDGVEWVSHDGVILKGTQPVVSLDNGLTGTADHLVLTSEGDYACLASIQAGARRPVALTDEAATGGLSDPDRPNVAGEAAPAGGGRVLTLREGLGEAGERLAERQVGMPLSERGEVRQGPAGQDLEGSVSRDSAEVYAGVGYRGESRGPRGSVSVRQLGAIHSLGAGEPAASYVPRDHLRSDRRLGALRAGELAVGNVPGAGDEHATERACAVHGADGCPTSPLAPGEARSAGLRADTERTGTEVAEGHVRGGSDHGSCTEALPVYDVLNAGPRHRFAVSGTIVSNCRDTYWTLRLYEAHQERMIPDPDDPPMFPDELEDARLGLLMENVSMPTVRALAGIEQRGIGLDVDWVYGQIAEEEAARDEAFETLTDLYPGHDREAASFAPTSNWFKAWAQTAVQQDDLRILSTTRQGSPQWNKAVLNKLARKGFWVAETLLAYRTAVKRIEFLKSWLMHATGEPPRIHAQYNVGTVVTGRLSSSNPNMQQVAKAIRPAFAPAPGYYLAELDYSQIELRVAAFISRCEPMLEAFRRGDDLHRLLAARITGKRPADVTKDERQKGKSANFGLLYDISAEGYQTYAETAYGVELSLTEAKATQHAFFEMWHGLRSWHSDARDRAQSRGQVMSPLGRVRRLDGIWSDDQYEIGQAQRAAINSPVQGMASDIMQIAVASIEGKMPGVEPVRGARIVGTVHDSIMVEIPKDRWREVGEACQRVMEEGVPEVLKRMSCHLDIPLKADLEVGTRWGVSDILGE